MAHSWLVFSSFCVILILFNSNLEIQCSQDIYLYDTQNRDDLKLSLHLFDSHHIQKRDVTLTTTIKPATTTAIPIPSHEMQVKPTIDTNNSTSKLLGKNLGENGAGIRQNYTTKPTAPPIPSSTVNDDLIFAKNNQTDGDQDEISISKFFDENIADNFNKTLQKHNITETKTDTHIYYNSTFTVDTAAAERYWVDMENNRTDVKINGLLSKSHRRAATVKLSFDFPFYGHIIQNITIATGGFLYTGEYVHSWLAATQYIAPLMANFDTSLSNDSFIKYVDNGTSFTVQWEKVLLQDKPEDGEFTFQTTLFNNGDIVFVYKTIPLIIEKIKDDHHPVKVGLSDAYIIDRNIFFVRRKTIYEYHRVIFNKEDIKNTTVIYLKALPTCLDNKDCDSCLTKKIDNFQCTWCPAINRCSNGLDRHRQDWLMKCSDHRQITNESHCSQANLDGYSHDGHEFYYGSNKSPDNLDHPSNDPSQVNNNSDGRRLNSTLNEQSRTLAERARNAEGSFEDKQPDTLSDTIQASRISPDSEEGVKMGASGIVVILLMIALAAGSGVWALYAYRNPHTTSGQILIRYRPSQWRWKRGEARYTAATIHMYESNTPNKI